jgi:iron complex transport system ATP-binding protein
MNHLDLTYQIELLEHLERWQRKENGVIVAVFHDLNLVRSFADRVLLLDNGHMAALDTCDRVLSGKEINRVFEMDVAAWMQSALRRWEK